MRNQDYVCPNDSSDEVYDMQDFKPYLRSLWKTVASQAKRLSRDNAWLASTIGAHPADAGEIYISGNGMMLYVHLKNNTQKEQYQYRIEIENIAGTKIEIIITPPAHEKDIYIYKLIGGWNGNLWYDEQYVVYSAYKSEWDGLTVIPLPVSLLLSMGDNRRIGKVSLYRNGCLVDVALFLEKPIGPMITYEQQFSITFPPEAGMTSTWVLLGRKNMLLAKRIENLLPYVISSVIIVIIAGMVLLQPNLILFGFVVVALTFIFLLAYVFDRSIPWNSIKMKHISPTCPFVFRQGMLIPKCSWPLTSQPDSTFLSAVGKLPYDEPVYIRLIEIDGEKSIQRIHSQVIPPKKKTSINASSHFLFIKIERKNAKGKISAADNSNILDGNRVLLRYNTSPIIGIGGISIKGHGVYVSEVHPALIRGWIEILNGNKQTLAVVPFMYIS